MLEPAWTIDTAEWAWRDPLRLYRVGRRLLDALLPSFTAVTAHAPYYWLYPWVLWSAGDRPATELRRLVINAEKAYVLASLRNHYPDKCPLGGGMQGISLIRDQYLEADSVNLADFGWLGSGWGGLGAQYLGVLERTHLLDRTRGVPRITEEARLLCSEANGTLRETPLLSVASLGRATESDLQAIATGCCPCRVHERFSKRGDPFGGGLVGRERGRTCREQSNRGVRLLHDLDAFLERHNLHVTTVDMRAAVYSGYWRSPTADLIPVVIERRFESARQVLRLVQATQYGVHAFEAAFRGALLAIRDREVTDELVARASEVARARLGVDVDLRKPVDAIWQALPSPEPWSDASEQALDHDLLGTTDPANCVGWAFSMLITLLARFRNINPVDPAIGGTPQENAWAAFCGESIRERDDLSFWHLYHQWHGIDTAAAIRTLVRDLTLLRHHHYVRERGVPSVWIDYGVAGIDDSTFAFRLDYDRADADRPSWRIGNLVLMLRQLGHWRSTVSEGELTIVGDGETDLDEEVEDEA